MSEVGYVIQRDDGAYVNKKYEWVSGAVVREVLCKVHRDQVLNELIELNIKSYDLRAQVLEIALNEKGMPQLQVSYEEPTEPILPDLAEASAIDHEEKSTPREKIEKSGISFEYES